MSISAMMMLTEANRRRDSRGRYMEGGESPSMNGAEMNGYAMGRYDDGAEMRGRNGGYGGGRVHPGRGTNTPRNAMDGDQRRMGDHEDGPRMGGYGGFVWDRMTPIWPRSGGDDEDDDDEGDDQQKRGNITSMMDYKRHHEGEQRKIGFGEGRDNQHMSRKEAEEWVAMMEIPGDKPGDMKRGGKWTYDEIKRYAANYGISGEQQIIDFFVAINMMYSDYCKVAKKFGLDKVDYYAEMAKAFLHDTDAVKDKLVFYWEKIVQKE